jgi:hypothetical protein
MNSNNSGFARALQYPLFSAIVNRRSRRVSKGMSSIPAGSLSYTSTQEAQPLTPLEEAMLVAATGTTGIVMPDVPFETEDGRRLPGVTFNLEITARAASSPDNAQAAHFLLINDSGTYFIKRPADVDPFALSDDGLTEDRLVEYVEKCKVRLLDQRLDFPRVFPCYIGANRYVSNLPGTTILYPIVDMTKQYINGLMTVLAQEDGERPVFLDDWYFYRKAGLKKWVKNGFLNKDIPLPLGQLGGLRTDFEAHLLTQNLLLTMQAMGLGGWIHAGFYGPLLFGDEAYARYGPGLQFRFHKPKGSLVRLLRRAITPLPAWRANPVGLDGILEGYCPPYYENMDDAVDAVVATKYGPGGAYQETKYFDQVFKPGLTRRYLDEVPHYPEDVIACTKDICNYIYNTYGRFPAHIDAMYVPGTWVQAQHVDLQYYDHLFTRGYSETQANHQHLWHSSS